MCKQIVKHRELMGIDHSVAIRILTVKHKDGVSSASFRLFWPKSKCYDYLYQEAETLLKNFPIQATISFYEDSDS